MQILTHKFTEEAPQLQPVKNNAKAVADKKRKGESPAEKASPAAKKLKAMGMHCFVCHY